MTGEMTGNAGHSGIPAGHEIPAKTTPFPVWDEYVRLHCLPSPDDMNVVYRHLMGLSRMNLRVEFPEKNVPLMRPAVENLFEIFQFLGPLRNAQGESLNNYPDICYFIEDPFVVADDALRLRKTVSVEELFFALRNPDDWTGFWETAIRGLKAWGENHHTLKELSRKVREIWPEVPDDSLTGFWLAQMSMTWMKYGQCYFMTRKNDLIEDGSDSQFMTREIWDPIQSLGEWGAGYLRAWSTGFFDTIWYYRLRSAPPEEKMTLFHEMQVNMRILKGRYLMLSQGRDEMEYKVNPTYSEEYMTVF